MSMFSIPGLDGYKTAIAGWALLITGVGELLMTVGQCIGGALDLNVCIDKIPALFQALVTAAAGVGILGIGHKVEKLNKKDAPQP